MSAPPSKQAVVEFRTSKSRPSVQTLQRPSLRAAPSESKRRLLSKISVFGFLGSRMFFHKRGDRLKVPKYQNTYRLEPFRAYHADDVDKIVKNIMERKLSAVTSYDPQQAAQLTSEIGTDVQKTIIRKDYDSNVLASDENQLAKYWYSREIRKHFHEKLNLPRGCRKFFRNSCPRQKSFELRVPHVFNLKFNESNCILIKYKVVTQVGIGQRLDQGIHASFQCLWDVERDNYSYYVFENNHIHAWCCVFGIYYE